MKVVIRADSSLQIGTGHIMRCRTLAHALRQRRADVSFICRAHDGHIAALLSKDGYDVHLLAPPRTTEAPIDDLYARWLGVTEDEDAAETKAALGDVADVLIVDHYGLSARWEESLRPKCARIVAIDDLGRTHTADIVLDQNFARAPQARYAGRVSPKCQLLLGPHFALLGPEYADLAAAPRARGRPVKRILVFFGGADTSNLTGRTIDALTDPAFGQVEVDVVVGPANPNGEAIVRAADARARTTVHRGLPSLAWLMAEADLAIGAGGGTTWERCALGLPTIVVSIADNQVPASEALNASGVIHYLGPDDRVSVEVIRESVRALTADGGLRQTMAEQGRLLVDGHGPARVLEAMIPSPQEALTLRPARAEDCEFHFRLANDPDVRRQSFSSDMITWDGHKRWYQSKLHSSWSHLYVLEANGLAVGQIRFERHEGTARLGYALDPLVRGRGWAVPLVTLGLHHLAIDAPADVLAEVRLENPASRAVFDKLGFDTDLSEDRSRHYLSREQLRARFLKEI